VGRAQPHPPRAGWGPGPLCAACSLNLPHVLHCSCGFDCSLEPQPKISSARSVLCSGARRAADEGELPPAPLRPRRPPRLRQTGRAVRAACCDSSLFWDLSDRLSCQPLNKCSGSSAGCWEKRKVGPASDALLKELSSLPSVAFETTLGASFGAGWHSHRAQPVHRETKDPVRRKLPSPPLDRDAGVSDKAGAR